MIDFWWNKNKYGYCIIGSYKKKLFEMWLSDISFLLKLDRNVLCLTLKNNFHGFVPEGTADRVYFENQLDVEEAIQWLKTVKISLLLT